MNERADRSASEKVPAQREQAERSVSTPAPPGTLQAELRQSPQVQAIAQLQSELDESPPVRELAQLRHSLNQPVQRVVPTVAGAPKPVPDVEGYNPHGRDKIFRAADYPRRMFAFQAITKQRVIAKSDPVYDYRGEVIQIRASGNLVPLAGAQMDHEISWDDIVQVMDEHNRQMDAQNAPLSAYYTLRDARLYYNDVSNLHFALGAHNAAAGSSGVPRLEDVHDDFRAPSGFIAAEWANLQQMLHAVSGGVTADQASAVFDRLAELGGYMRETYNFVAGMVQTGSGASSSSQLADDTAMDQGEPMHSSSSSLSDDL